MRQVSLSVSARDRKTLEDQRINIAFVEGLLCMVLNAIKPCKRTVVHKLKLVFTEQDCSQYQFDDKLYVTYDCFKNTSIRKRHHDFFSDLLHELGHYIQYKIDKVLFSMFAIDHDITSYSKYYNNVTEKQARKYGSLANELAQFYIRAEKLRVECSKPLTNLRNGKANKKGTKAQEGNQRAAN